MMGNVMQKTVISTEKGYNEMQGQKVEMDETAFENARKEAALFPELHVDQNEITLVGVVSIDGKDAYEIKWSDKKSIYYSVDDFLKLQSVETNEVQGQIQSATTSYGEFKAVEGILFPHLIKQNMGPQKIDFNIKSISLNEPMEDSLFE